MTLQATFPSEIEACPVAILEALADHLAIDRRSQATPDEEDVA